jgi:hypothetical protein
LAVSPPLSLSGRQDDVPGTPGHEKSISNAELDRKNVDFYELHLMVSEISHQIFKLRFLASISVRF